jgi:hypothetical protein
MNKNILFLFAALSFFSAFSQDGDISRRDPRAREKIRAAHAAYITERLDLTSSEAEKFWPVYREYRERRRDLRQQVREAKRKGTDEKSLLEIDLKIKQQELDLEKEYSLRFQNIISPEKVIKLHQAEIDFRRLLLRQIQERRKP